MLTDSRDKTISLENSNGLRAVLSTYGASLFQMHVPDRNGKLADVVLGFDNLEGYQRNADSYFGSTVGRYANRITKGQFTLNGKTFQLSKQNGIHLHGGGDKALSKKIWAIKESSKNHVTFQTSSADGDEGYPGNLDVEVTYTLTAENELKIAYKATCDQDTIINLTNHSYWNLGGEDSGSISDHRLQVHASEYLPWNEDFSPKDQFSSLDGHPLDFRNEKRLAPLLNDQGQLALTGGVDHSYKLANNTDSKLAAEYHHPGSGRSMKVWTTEASVHFYTANHLSQLEGKNAHKYNAYDAICFECQNFPDAINQPEFPSPILKKDQVFQSLSIYQFSNK